MKVKKMVIEIAVFIQCMVFLFIGTFGDFGLQTLSSRNVFNYVLWTILFVIIDYVHNKEYVHAIKMGIIYSVIWSVIESGLFYLIWFFAENNSLFCYLIYGLQNVACLFSVLWFTVIYGNDKKKRSKPIVWLMIICLIIFVVVTYEVINNVPVSNMPDFEDGNLININYLDMVTGSSIVYYQDVIMRRIIILFYLIEGVLFSTYCRKSKDS